MKYFMVKLTEKEIKMLIEATCMYEENGAYFLECVHPAEKMHLEADAYFIKKKLYDKLGIPESEWRR